MTWKPWALFGLSLLCFAVVLKSQSLGVALPLLAVALVSMVWGTLLLVQARIEGVSQNGSLMVDPMEVARLRAQAEERKRSAQETPSEDSASA
jgi:hypothetical protein